MTRFRQAYAVKVLAAVLLSPATVAAQEKPVVALDTTLGTIVLELEPTRAPATVDNFLRYVESDFYDNTLFHRVIDGFMIQGGGFNPDYTRKATRAPIHNEANNGLDNRRYSIAMARTNAPHSATSQFFINSADNPNLNYRGQTPTGWGYTVFGQVIEGQEVVDAISTVATGQGGPFRSDVPKQPILIKDARALAGEGLTAATRPASALEADERVDATIDRDPPLNAATAN